MAKYRKKPVVIEAEHASRLIWKSANEWKALPKWMIDAYERGEIVFTPNEIHINTLEGRMIADAGDMVICGVKGEIYPCKPDIFSQTYEYVSQTYEYVE